MQVDIKTQTVTQLRNTFSHVARRIGGDKPASRYQEAMYDLQPEVNFHYRPLWQPEMAIYDRRRTAVVMADWYLLKDPRQFYYGTYTMTRGRQQETTEKNIDFADRRGLFRALPEELKRQLVFGLVPLRHVEWGANSNNCYITAYAWGTALTQSTMFHTMDRLALAQYLSRIGLLLDENTGNSLTEAKTLWLQHPAWQGLRRITEQLMATRDWFELFIGQNLVLDGLLHPLVFQQYEARVTEASGPTLSLVTEFFSNWQGETSKWVDAVVKVAAAESAENAALLAQWTDQWRAKVLEAIRPYALELFGDDASATVALVDAALNARVAKLGLKLAEAA